MSVKNMNNDDETNRNMTTNMKVKFDKYWSDYNVVLALGTILDPHYDLPFLKF